MKLRYFYWPAFFFFLGVVSVLGQAFLLREMTTLFHGNEIFYGLGLGSWLLFTGLGSLLAKKLGFLSNKNKWLWLVLSSWFLFLFILIIGLRFLVAYLVAPGVLPNLGFSFLVLNCTFFVFCFPLGMMFAWGAAKFKVSRAYFWETIGFTAGGLFFSFLLATRTFSLGLKWRYPKLTQVFNSRYQQILISQKDGQFSYFLGGQLAFTNQEEFEAEQLASLIKPFSQEPGNFLVLGNPNLAGKIGQEFAGKTTFLEMDRKLLELEKELLGEKAEAVAGDLKRYLLQGKEKYNLVVFSLGNPQTLLGNRLYTQESFIQVRDCLDEKGIFVLLSYLPTDYQSQEALFFGASLWKTLKSVFPAVELLILEDQLLFFAAEKAPVFSKEKIISRYKNYFWHQINNPQKEEILAKLKKTPAKINSDFVPVTFFYAQLFWQTIDNFQTPVLLAKMTKIVPALLIILLLVFIQRGSPNLRLGIAVISSSFILMSLEILLIFAFQSRAGYLYSQISLIFAAVLLGLGLGVIWAEKNKHGLKSLLAAYLPFLFLIKQTDYWLLGALGVGLVGGMIFSTANRIYFKREKNPGFIYACDLFGAFLGAFLTSSFLLPSFGFYGLAGIILLIMIINLTAKLPE